MTVPVLLAGSVLALVLTLAAGRIRRGPRRPKGFAVERLDRFDKESGQWIEAVVEDSRTPVPDQVAFRIDFPAWLRLQTKRNRRIAEALAVGNTTGEVARRFKLSPARISQLRQDFHQSWQEFYGETAGATACPVVAPTRARTSRNFLRAR